MKGKGKGYLVHGTVGETHKGKSNAGLVQNREQQLPVSFGPRGDLCVENAMYIGHV